MKTMKTQEFVKLFIEELEIENSEINLDTELSTIEEWNSMAVMLVIAIADDHFGVQLKNEDIQKATNIRSLTEIIGIKNFE